MKSCILMHNMIVEDEQQHDLKLSHDPDCTSLFFEE